MKKHARLGPSGWDRWSNCPGSPALCDTVPNTTSRYAAQGSVAHEVADRVLREDVASAGALLGEVFEQEGFSIEVDDEMVEAVDQYVETVRQQVNDGLLFPEQAVPIGHLTGETGAAGTSDAIVIAGKRMTVIDLKYGMGVRVNAEGNGQGRMYALGALQKFGSAYEDIEEVEVMIVQPRLPEGTSMEVLSIGELEEFKDEVELAAGLVALADGARGTDEFEEHLVVGEKQCKFCSAAGICPALRKDVGQQLAPLSECSAEDFADLTLPKQASSLSLKPDASNEQLAEFLRAVPLIEQAITSVRAEVERRLFDSQEIPGFYLGVGRKGNRKWSTEVDIENELKKRLGAQAYEKKVISVPTAEKMFKSKPRTWAKIKDLVTQSEGRPSVCAEGDSNAPYVPVSAEDFADLSVTAQSEAERLLG